MAIELQITTASALVTSEPREKQTYDGRGDDRRVKGRATDDMGRPVSVVSAVVVAEPMGLLPDAQVQLPDLQMTGLRPGMVIQLDGRMSARLMGGDYASIRTTVTAERLTPLGDFVEWIHGAQAPKPRAEAKAS
jgi:hypothetical protein